MSPMAATRRRVAKAGAPPECESVQVHGLPALPAPLSNIAAQNTAIAEWAPKCLSDKLRCEQESTPGLFPKMATGSGVKKESARASSDACLAWHTLYRAALFETDRTRYRSESIRRRGLLLPA